MRRSELTRMAVLLALLEDQAETTEDLERRVAEPLELGEEEMRRRGRELRGARFLH